MENIEQKYKKMNKRANKQAYVLFLYTLVHKI